MKKESSLTLNIMELQNKKHLLKRILGTEPSTVYIYDLAEQRYVHVNRNWVTVLGFSLAEMKALGSALAKLFHPDDLPSIAANHQAWKSASNDETRAIEYRIRDKGGRWHWLTSRETPFARDNRGQVSQILGIAYDITARKRAELLLSTQKQVLEMVASGIPLPETLTTLIRLIEDQSPGTLGSILLLDKDGVHVRHGAAPSLPSAFVAAVDGQPIGPSAGSCGTAAYRKKAVFVEDISIDPLWSDYKAAAAPHGLRACWSTPIFDAQGLVLGTFAMYYRQPGLPQPEHLRLIETATHTASIAIGHHKLKKSLLESKARLVRAQHVAHMGFLEWNLKTNQVFCSDEVYEMYGIHPEEGYTTTDFLLKIVHPDDIDYVQANLDRAVRHIKEYDIDHRIKRFDGKVIWVHAQAELTSDPDGNTEVLLGTIVDITDRKAAEAKVQRLTQLYATLSQCNQAIVRCANEEELFPQICSAAVNFGGMKLAWIGMLDESSKTVKPVASFGAGIEYLDGLEISVISDDPSGRRPSGRSIRENKPIWCQDFQRDPATAPWHASAAKFGLGASASLPLHRKGVAIGAFTLYTGEANGFDEPAQNLLIEMAMDISFALDRFVSEDERKQAEEKVQYLAFYDPLTPLPNRRLLADRIQQAMAASTRSERHGALISLDLDQFKQLNDTLGHSKGDKLLIEVARRLQTIVREEDTVARQGGDEFMVVLNELSSDQNEAAIQAEIVAEKIRSELCKTYQLGETEYNTSSSIGIVIFRNHSDNQEDLLAHVDAAMYQAKAKGRNTICFFDSKMQGALEKRSQLESALRVALSRQEFKLYYQLQVDNHGNPIGAEALLRWAHPELGMVSPAQFIPLAEETGLILPIGHWVLETACAQLVQWQADPRLQHLSIAVNVSARQFRESGFVAQVSDALKKSGIKPEVLKLELTESLVIADVEDSISKIKELKSLGIKFSMDDFGTGYSSLSYLSRLPIDQLKIDQSFVRNITIVRHDAVIVQAIISMAQSLGLDVIAEGVETDAQREFLELRGCLAYQGYFFAKPLPIDDLARKLHV